MKTNSKINKSVKVLTASDTYSLMLFALYKLKDIPEYSTLSELAYILDKKSLLEICELFGGLTIKIPTKLELLDITQALYLYQRIDIEHEDVKVALSEIGQTLSSYKLSDIKPCYDTIRELLQQYSFGDTINAE